MLPMGQEAAQLAAETMHTAREKVFLPLKVWLQIHCDITACRLTQSAAAALVGDDDGGDRVAGEISFFRAYAGQPTGIFSDSTQLFSGFQCQIGWEKGHILIQHSLQGTKCCGIEVVCRIKKLLCKKVQKKYSIEEAAEIGKHELEQELENEISNKDNILRKKHKHIPKRGICRGIYDI